MTEDGKRYVWLVYYDNYGDRWLDGVYDSEEKTDPYKPKDPDRPWRCDYEITKALVR